MRLGYLLSAAVACAALVSSARSLGQEMTPQVSAEQAPAQLNPVEHGLYAGTSIGVLFLHLPGTGSGIGSGAMVGASFGYDFSPLIGVGFFGLGLALNTPSGYEGLGTAPTASGDLTALFPGLEVVLRLPLSRDRDDIDRLFFNIAAGGGALFLNPTGLVGTQGVLPAGKADLSLEYFTHLRHFSVGLALDGLLAFPTGGTLIGGALSPFARYSF
jgi:hypothetical protein